MRIFKKTAAIMSAAGLLAFGAVVASGGSALATTGQSVTGCSELIGTLALGLQPNCTAADTTVDNPSSLTITVNTSALSALIDAIPDLGMDTSWTLSCVVNGSPVSAPGSYDITSTEQSASTTIDLETTVGSPEPSSCTISDLKVQTSIALSIGALSLSPFSIGLDATADTATPGAVYANYPNDSLGAHAVVCADDTNNGESGTSIQAFQCLSDQADYWVQVSTHQFVHNGDCLTDFDGSAMLATCIANPTNRSGQVWVQQNASGAGTLTNANGGGCLTAPSSGTIDFAILQVATCHGAVGQEWTVPAVTVVPSITKSVTKHLAKRLATR
jgi:hypothetical protein